ncbi:unnamed protein product [Caenorhabditis angaria]|uniref:Uncharacterized protein n=1 Tax=Caenorhabditis angaria TaxID=860376 RepID=A0A9P1IK15_9PELO|nr:unnamed protein product [Caenorhabditis angaria]
MAKPTNVLVFIIICAVGPSLCRKSFLEGDCYDGVSQFCGENGKCMKGPYSPITLKRMHWCRCDDGFGGESCEKVCDAQCGANQKCVFDGVTGLAKCVCKDCDKFGNEIFLCESGWGGPECTEQGACYFDDATCLNGGKCNGTKCICPDGLTGSRCEVDIDECLNDPYLRRCNGGKCFNTFGSYECDCPEGFLPPYCNVIGTPEEMLDPDFQFPPDCVIVNNQQEQCSNFGECLFDNNATRCECPQGFRGEICENDIDECREMPGICQNSGKCENLYGGFLCHCADGFSGEFCEVNFDDCLNNTACGENGICRDGNNRFTCECRNNTMGQFCQFLNPCKTGMDLCNSHGTCTPLPGTGGFTCDCKYGFYGDFCEIDIDECQTRDKPDDPLCYHQGKCVNTPGSWKCECRRGYNGTKCERALNLCEIENFECENGGECWMASSDWRTEPVCVCPEGFVGKHCEIQCPGGYGGAKCVLDLSQPTCGREIEQVCYNGGKCNEYGHCNCHPNYIGTHCEMERAEAEKLAGLNCAQDPCLNAVKCVNVTGTTDGIGYWCICKDGYEGDVCEKKKDYCATNPCFNGATCNKKPNGYSCKCPADFTGPRCEERKPFRCAENTCQNGGICNKDAKCECPDNYFGPNCSEKLNADDFYTKDRLIREKCDARNCTSRAADGNCDLDCNFAACDFDGGDCSGRRKPFANCKYGNICANLFGDGKCHQFCNNEDCLWDGLDCMAKVSRCARQEKCAKQFGDGKCDEECNSEECGFDGGDCEKETTKNTTGLLQDIRVIIQMTPENFRQNGGAFLLELGQTLRSIIRIQRDSEGPLVFEWKESEGFEGARVQMDTNKLEEQQLLAKETARRFRRTTFAQNNDDSEKLVAVYLEIEKPTEKCLSDGYCMRFSSSQSVVDFLAAEIARSQTSLSGKIPVSEAIVMKPGQGSKNSNSWFNSSLILVIIGFILLGSTVAGVIVMNGDDKRSRKRKIISAPIWMPPTEQEEKSRKNGSQNSLLQFSSTNYYSEAKRVKFVPGANNNLAYFEHFQQPNTMSKLHLLAASSIGTPQEEAEIINQVELALEAGENVNARDSDDNTPLILAVKTRRTRLAIILMKAGADPTIFNRSERSALHEAVVNLDLRMVQILLTDKRMCQEIDELDRNGRTALMEIARLDQDVQIAKLLISKGAKIEADGAARKDSEVYKGRTALHYACLCNNMRMAEYLIGLNANKDKQDEAGQTPIMLAAKEGHLHMVRYLIGCGASLESTDLMDNSARRLAEQHHHYEIVEIIDQGIVDKEFSDTQIRQAQTNKITKASRPTIKSVKRNASRKSGPPTPQNHQQLQQHLNLNHQTPHLTPPPSDGSPSPIQYSTSLVNTSSSGAYNLSNPGSNNTSVAGSTGMVSDASSPEYQPQDSSDMSNLSTGGGTWYSTSPPYHHPQNAPFYQPGIYPDNNAFYY